MIQVEICQESAGNSYYVITKGTIIRETKTLYIVQIDNVVKKYKKNNGFIDKKGKSCHYQSGNCSITSLKSKDKMLSQKMEINSIYREFIRFI